MKDHVPTRSLGAKDGERARGISNIPFTGWKSGWEGNGSSQGKPTTGHHFDRLSSSITRICWPSNMMSLFISCIPIMWTQGESTILCGYFLSHCILGYVCFLQEDHLAFENLLTLSLAHYNSRRLLFSFFLNCEIHIELLLSLFLL